MGSEIDNRGTHWKKFYAQSNDQKVSLPSQFAAVFVACDVSQLKDIAGIPGLDTIWKVFDLLIGKQYNTVARIMERLETYLFKKRQAWPQP